MCFKCCKSDFDYGHYYYYMERKEEKDFLCYEIKLFLYSENIEKLTKYAD